MDTIPEFNDVIIQQLFGHEAAEDEDPERLRSYYFKQDVFSRITAPLPLRILVGHKGIGKSALISVAMKEDEESNDISILVRPDDISGLKITDGDFLLSIREWKQGLMHIIINKLINENNDVGLVSRASQLLVKGIDIVQGVLKPILENYADLTAVSESIKKKIFSNSTAINMYVDDLDRGYAGLPGDISRLSAMLNAMRDLSREYTNLRFKVALRTDVYFLIRTADESTDKIEGSVVWHTWSNHEILAMLVKRIETFFGRDVEERNLIRMKQSELRRYLNPVMEPIFLGSGHWHHCPTHRFLMTLIRKRPRDIVKLCSLGAQAAAAERRTIIQTSDWKSVLTQYSQGRLQDTVNEFRSELPKIHNLIIGFKPNQQERKQRKGYIYTTSELLDKIGNINSIKLKFFNGNVATERQLAAFLYKINFITARRTCPSGYILRKYFEENSYLVSDFYDFGFDWEMHPAYRWALEADEQTIWESLAPTEEEEEAQVSASD